MREHFLEVHGHRIAAIEHRSDSMRTPIILIHGITMSVRMWQPVLNPSLIESRTWISLSLPGHFPSTAPSQFCEPQITPTLFSDIVCKVIQELCGGEPVHLVGWSTGGFTALATAIAHPELVASVVSISGFANGQWGHLLGFMQTLASRTWTRPLFQTIFRLLQMRQRSLQLIIHLFAGEKKLDMQMSTEVADAVFSDFRQHRTTDLAMLFSALRMVSIADQLNSIRVPVRIIGGTNDPVIPFRETRNLADTIPNADLQPLPGIGHLFYAEDNQHVQHLLLDWIRQHSPST